MYGPGCVRPSCGRWLRRGGAYVVVVLFIFDGAQIRTVVKDGEPWFVAKDVAEVLGYKEPGLAVRTHCKGGVKHTLPTKGGIQEMTIIPERDVYRLIMRSKLPSAERFEEWVVAEVLPTIRKTGQYVADAPKSDQDKICISLEF